MFHLTNTLQFHIFNENRISFQSTHLRHIFDIQTLCGETSEKQRKNEILNIIKKKCLSVPIFKSQKKMKINCFYFYFKIKK